MPKKPKHNEVACPKCKEPIAVTAEICPHCRTPFTPEEVAQRVKNHKKSMFAGCGCLVLVVALFAAFASGDEKGGSGSSASPNSTTAGSTVEEDPKPGSATPEVKAAAVQFYSDMIGSLSACDAAGKETARIAGRLQDGGATIYDGYSVSKAQEDACQRSWSAANDVKIPAGLPDGAKEAAEKAKETCANSALMKQVAAKAFEEVFDGDMRPSKISEAKEAADAAQSATLACASATFSTVLKAGVDVKDLRKND